MVLGGVSTPSGLAPHVATLPCLNLCCVQGRLVVLGGAFTCNGNVNPAAEANIFGDPDAANVVFGRCGARRRDAGQLVPACCRPWPPAVLACWACNACPSFLSPRLRSPSTHRLPFTSLQHAQHMCRGPGRNVPSRFEVPCPSGCPYPKCPDLFPPPPCRMPNTYVVGLDVTHRCVLTTAQIDSMEGRGRHGSFLRAITQFYLDYHRWAVDSPDPKALGS